MIQKLTILSKATKAVIIPNTILQKINEPEAFDLELIDGKIVLTPLVKKENNQKTNYADQSIDLYGMS